MVMRRDTPSRRKTVKNIAKLVKDNLNGFTGTAALYKLTPPLVEKDWNDKVKGKHAYVVVSATYAMFSGPETYIFPADKKGKITSWGELDGSYRGGTDHHRALHDAGYTVQS